jgi:transcriptional regulator with XRE-family HTH domain
MDGQAIRDTLGKNIKIMRARRGLSQAGLAEKADISIPFLSNIERGIKYPQPEMLSKIVNALEVEVGELFAADLGAGGGKELLHHLSEDITKDVNLAMEGVLRRYLEVRQVQGDADRSGGPQKDA